MSITAQPDTPFHHIELTMIERNQRFVPVMREATVIGVITRTDLLRTLHDDVLKAARKRTIRPGEPESEVGGPHRNVKKLLRNRLPREVVILLEEAGRLADRSDVAIFAVGGCVRDLLLGIQNLDLDLVVEGDGIAYARKLGEVLHARVKVHERFGTAVLLLPDGFTLDAPCAAGQPSTACRMQQIVGSIPTAGSIGRRTQAEWVNGAAASRCAAIRIRGLRQGLRAQHGTCHT